MRHDLLNESQRHALDLAFNHALGGMVCIEGPPGTGKSTTAAVITQAFALCGSQVLICAATNIAVDSMAAAVDTSWNSDAATIVQRYLPKSHGKQMRYARMFAPYSEADTMKRDFEEERSVLLATTEAHQAASNRRF